MAKLRQNAKGIGGSQAFWACGLGSTNEKSSLLPVFSSKTAHSMLVAGTSRLRGLCAALTQQPLWPSTCGWSTERADAASAWEGHHGQGHRNSSGLCSYEFPAWQLMIYLRRGKVRLIIRKNGQENRKWNFVRCYYWKNGKIWNNWPKERP